MQRRTFVLVSIFTISLFTLGLLQASPVRAQSSDLFETVKSELNKNRLKKSSFNRLQEFVEANPRNSDGRLYLGLVLERMGLKEQAYAQLKLAIEYGPDNPEALVELCKEEIRQGHINPAMALLDYGARKFPKHPEILFLIGEYLIKQKQPGKARSVLEQAFKLDKTIFGLPTAIAQVYLDHDPYRSVRYASLDLKVRPDYDRALRIRGTAYVRLNMFEKAAKDLLPVFEKDRTLTGIAAMLSRSYYWLGDYEKALRPAVYYLAFTSVPDIKNKAPTDWLVKVLRKVPRKKAFELVQKHMDEISSRFEVSAAYYFLGIAMDRVHYRDEAITFYRESIKGDPKQALPHYRLGLDLELYKRDYQAALEEMTSAHNLRPWDNEINLAYLRLQDRVYNRHRDISAALKEWFSGLAH